MITNHKRFGIVALQSHCIGKDASYDSWTNTNGRIIIIPEFFYYLNTVFGWTQDEINLMDYEIFGIGSSESNMDLDRRR